MTKKKLMDALKSNPEDLEIEEAWVIESGGTWSKFDDVEELIPHLMDRSLYGYSVSNVEFGKSRSRQGGALFITLKRSKNLKTNIDYDFLQGIMDNYGMEGE